MHDAIRHLVATGPFPIVLLVMFLLVASRSNIIYGIGRYGRRLTMTGEEPAKGLRRRVWLWANAKPTLRAMDRIRRRGWIVISLAYLTVGIQTIVNVAAGVVGLSWPRYILAATPGWMAWALIYSTIGYAVWRAAVAAAAGSPAGILAIAALVLLAVVVCLALRKRRKSRPASLAPQEG